MDGYLNRLFTAYTIIKKPAVNTKNHFNHIVKKNWHKRLCVHYPLSGFKFDDGFGYEKAFLFIKHVENQLQVPYPRFIHCH